MNTENNKIIAEFMGYIDNGCSEEGFLINPITNYDEDINELKFHSDWNWLMEVVEKIESLKVDNLSFNFEIQKDVVTLCYTHTRTPKEQTDMYFEWGQKTKIGNVYEIVVKFIKWYNQQNK